jgi:hypothetical protein
MWLVLVLILGVMITGNVEAQRSGKTLTITGITGKTGDAMVALFSTFEDIDSVDNIAAYGEGIISRNTVTFPLYYDDDDSPFTGSGFFYIFLFFEDDDSCYCYTNGQTMGALGLSAYSSDEEVEVKLPKYNVSSLSTTIAFNRFKEAPDWSF